MVSKKDRAGILRVRVRVRKLPTEPAAAQKPWQR